MVDFDRVRELPDWPQLSRNLLADTAAFTVSNLEVRVQPTFIE